MTKLRECSSGEKKVGSYYSLYDRHFESRQEDELRVLEIGIQGGGSLRMWEKYFLNSKIVGVDIDPGCARHATDNTEVFIGDQANEEFIGKFKDFDIIIDDGSHTWHAQQFTFKTLFHHMRPGGIYVIEDLHTSYWRDFNDTDKPTTNFIADLIDDMNSEALSEQRSLNRQIKSSEIAEIHVYPSIAFIIKK